MKVIVHAPKTYTLADLCSDLGKELYVIRTQAGYAAFIERAEIKDGSVLISASGTGHCPAEAVSDFVRRIAGRRLVVRAYTADRREITVPPNLTPGEIEYEYL